MKKKIVYKRISISVILAGLILSAVYRPYIYKNNLFDYGFADTIGSLVSVIGFCTFVWYKKEYSNKSKNIHIILAILIYGFLWEFLGYIKLYGTFDWKDIVAAILSGVFTYFIKLYVEHTFSLY